MNLSICPECEGPIRDLRDSAFNPDAIAREGTCYLWGSTYHAYTCVKRYRRDLPIDHRLPKTAIELHLGHGWLYTYDRMGPCWRLECGRKGHAAAMDGREEWILCKVHLLAEGILTTSPVP